MAENDSAGPDALLPFKYPLQADRPGLLMHGKEALVVLRAISWTKAIKWKFQISIFKGKKGLSLKSKT
jgi:hypothetical protein